MNKPKYQPNSVYDNKKKIIRETLRILRSLALKFLKHHSSKKHINHYLCKPPNNKGSRGMSQTRDN